MSSDSMFFEKDASSENSPLKWVGLAALAAAVGAALWFGRGMMHPTPRTDLYQFAILGNSQSESSMGLKRQIGLEAAAISSSLGERPVQTWVDRYSSTTKEIYAAPNGQDVNAAIRTNYIEAPADPVSGSNLSLALEAALKVIRTLDPKAVCVVTVGTDGFEDKVAVRKVAEELKARGVIVLVHGLPITEERQRENARYALEPLGDNALFCSSTDFAATLQRLQDRIRARGVTL